MEAVLAFVGTYLLGRYYLQRQVTDPGVFEAWVAWSEGYNAGWGDSLKDKPLDLENVDPFDWKPTYWSDEAFVVFKEGYLAGWSDHDAGRSFFPTPSPYKA